MTIAGKNICLAILLGLLIGHASVALHTATHTAPDSGHCGICLSYGDLSKAIPDSSATYPFDTGESYVAIPGWNSVPQSRRTLVRQRSPPVPT